MGGGGCQGRLGWSGDGGQGEGSQGKKGATWVVEQGFGTDTDVSDVVVREMIRWYELGLVGYDLTGGIW